MASASYAALREAVLGQHQVSFTYRRVPKPTPWSAEEALAAIEA